MFLDALGEPLDSERRNSLRGVWGKETLKVADDDDDDDDDDDRGSAMDVDVFLLDALRPRAAAVPTFRPYCEAVLAAGEGVNARYACVRTSSSAATARQLPHRSSSGDGASSYRTPGAWTASGSGAPAAQGRGHLPGVVPARAAVARPLGGGLRRLVALLRPPRVGSPPGRPGHARSQATTASRPTTTITRRGRGFCPGRATWTRAGGALCDVLGRPACWPAESRRRAPLKLIVTGSVALGNPVGGTAASTPYRAAVVQRRRH